MRTLFCFSSLLLLFFLKSLNLVDTDKCHSIIGFVEIVFWKEERTDKASWDEEVA